LFAIQFRFSLVPQGTTLTFSELLTDKLRLDRVWRRRQEANQARQLLAKGDAAGAARMLEDALALGEDRSVDESLIAAWRAAGDNDRAAAADARYRRFLESRLY
jgi:hypothetical protein